jgi:hypothetical protein
MAREAAAQLRKALPAGHRYNIWAREVLKRALPGRAGNPKSEGRRSSSLRRATIRSPKSEESKR